MTELKEIVRKLAESTLKFLIAINAAGIVAVCALIRVKAVGVSSLMLYGAACYVFGIIICGALLFRLLIRMYVVDKKFSKNDGNWARGEITWDEWHEDDEKITQNDYFEFSLCFGAAFSFLAGVGFTFSALACV